MTAPTTRRRFARARHALVCGVILLATAACDEPRTNAKAEPPAPQPAPSSTSAAALHPPAPPASTAGREPIVDPDAVPASGGAPPSAPTQASAARPLSPQTDPSNPCATRYEERTQPDGTVTRVLIPKDKRCGQMREGGLSPRGDVYGY